MEASLWTKVSIQVLCFVFLSYFGAITRIFFRSNQAVWSDLVPGGFGRGSCTRPKKIKDHTVKTESKLLSSEQTLETLFHAKHLFS